MVIQFEIPKSFYFGIIIPRYCFDIILNLEQKSDLLLFTCCKWLYENLARINGKKYKISESIFFPQQEYVDQIMLKYTQKFYYDFIVHQVLNV
jgi:hypothetical protein